MLMDLLEKSSLNSWSNTEHVVYFPLFFDAQYCYAEMTWFQLSSGINILSIRIPIFTQMLSRYLVESKSDQFRAS